MTRKMIDEYGVAWERSGPHRLKCRATELDEQQEALSEAKLKRIERQQTRRKHEARRMPEVS